MFLVLSTFIVLASCSQAAVTQLGIKEMDSFLLKQVGKEKLAQTRDDLQFTDDQLKAVQEALQKSILSANSQNSLEFHTKLLAATRMCNQKSLDFLELFIRNRATIEDQKQSPSLKLARSLTYKCWFEHLDRLARLIEIGLGKMPQYTFESVQLVANQLHWRNKPPRRASSNIQIDSPHHQENGYDGDEIEEEDSIVWDPLKKFRSNAKMTTEMQVQRIKAIDLSTTAGRREFALALNSLANLVLGRSGPLLRGERAQKVRAFYKEFLVQPCELIVERLSVILELGNHLRQLAKSLNIEPLKPTAGQKLAQAATSDARLEVLLQNYRVCRLVTQQSDMLLELLLSMF